MFQIIFRHLLSSTELEIFHFSLITKNKKRSEIGKYFIKLIKITWGFLLNEIQPNNEWYYLDQSSSFLHYLLCTLIFFSYPFIDKKAIWSFHYELWYIFCYVICTFKAIKEWYALTHFLSLLNQQNINIIFSIKNSEESIDNWVLDVAKSLFPNLFFSNGWQNKEYIFTLPFYLEQDVTQNQFLSRIQLFWIKLSFSLSGCLTKA